MRRRARVTVAHLPRAGGGGAAGPPPWVARAALVALTLATALSVDEAAAQCASCGNPAFVSAGNDMSRQRGDGGAGLSLRSTLAYGFTTSDTYFEGSHDVGSLDAFRADLHVFSLATSLEAPFGLALDVVLPWAILASERRFAGAALDRGLGDIELRLRQDALRPFGLGGATRVLVSVGLAAPTGLYNARQSVDDVNPFDTTGAGWNNGEGWEDIDITGGSTDSSSRYLSIGRDAWWLLADVEALGRLGTRFGWYTAVQTRFPLSNAGGDGFGWGEEVRGSIGANAVAIAGLLHAGVTAELLWRGKSTEVLYGERVDFANGGGYFGYVTPTVQAELGRGWTTSLSLRVPVLRDVVGTQVVDNTGIWLTVGGTFALGGAGAAEAATAPAAAPATDVAVTQVGEPPLRPDVAALLVPGKTTIIDYWATWCQPCQQLDVEIQAFVATAGDAVVVRRFDASDWDNEGWKHYLPTAPALPVLEIFGADGRLVRRLSGDEAFGFRDHLPAQAAP